MPKRLLKLDVNSPTIHEPMTSKPGSCSPPSLASSEKSDAEIDDSKEIFFQELKRRYKTLKITEDEMNIKISQMWDSMSDQNRQAVIKAAQVKGNFKVPEVPSSNSKPRAIKRRKIATISNNNNPTDPEKTLSSSNGLSPRKKEICNISRKNLDLVAKSLNIGIQKPLNVLPPPIRSDSSYADRLKHRMQLCNMETSHKSHLIPGLFSVVPRCQTPPLVLHEEDLEVNCSFPKLSYLHVKKDQKVDPKARKKVDPPKEEVVNEVEDVAVKLESPPPDLKSFEKQPPAPKWIAPKIILPPLPPKSPGTLLESLPNKRMLPKHVKAGQPNPNLNRTLPARTVNPYTVPRKVPPPGSRMIAVQRVFLPPKKPEPVNRDELEIKRMSFQKVCENYYLGLCQPLVPRTDEKPLTKYNQQSLANVVEGWKMVREYRGIL